MLRDSDKYCIHTRTVGWTCREAANEQFGNDISVRAKYRITEGRKEIKSRFAKEES